MYPGQITRQVAKKAVPLLGALRFNTRDQYIALAVLLLCALIRVWDPVYLSDFRSMSFDAMQKMYPRPVAKAAELPALIIDIDERSLAEYGQWPWPRTLVAKLVKNSRELGAALIAFDIVFAEYDRLSPRNILGNIEGLSSDVEAQIKALPSNDDTLASELSKFAVVLGRAVRYQTENDNLQKNDFPKTMIIERKLNGDKSPRDFLPKFTRLIPNINVLEKAAHHPYGGFGVFNVVPDRDGVIRKVPSFFAFDRCYIKSMVDQLGRTNCLQVLPSLALEILRVNTYRTTNDSKPRGAILVSSDQAGIRNIKVDNRLLIETDKSGYIWPYFSNSSKTRYISASDLLNKSVDKKLIAGKILLVGTSAVGLLDIRAVPTDVAMPGVEVQTQLLETILLNEYLLRPNYIVGAELFFVFIAGFLLIYLFPIFGAKWTSVLFLVLVGFAILVSVYCFVKYRILLDSTTPLLSLVIMYMALSYFGFIREESKKKETRNAFSKYLSPDMVERVSNNPEQLRLGGDQRKLTLLFCDVRGFTPISESFDPPGLTNLINQLLTPLTNVILSNKGTVDKYMGDCIMAFWNAPLDDDNHAYNACKSALLMLNEMDPLNERLKVQADREGRKHLDLKVGFGLNTGSCVVGNMGSEQRFDYSVLGDSVNLAARLEGQSKEYGVRIIIGETTADEVGELAILELDLILVKGKAKASRIYALLGDEVLKASDEFDRLSGLHSELLKEYRSQSWERAITMCNEMISISGEFEFEIRGFYELIKNRCVDFRENPPVSVGEEWDAVYTATSK
jgi:adenylate cyclase